MLDGTENNSAYFSGEDQIFAIADAIEEVSVQTGNFGAEFCTPVTERDAAQLRGGVRREARSKMAEQREECRVRVALPAQMRSHLLVGILNPLILRKRAAVERLDVARQRADRNTSTHHQDDRGAGGPRRVLCHRCGLSVAALCGRTAQCRPRPQDGAAAKTAMEQALAKDPKSPEAQLARGLYAMYVTKNLDQATTDLKAVVNLRPNSSDALQSLGFALRRSGHMEEAIGYFSRAWDLDPLNSGYTDSAIITRYCA